jgi:carbonic anhydrase
MRSLARAGFAFLPSVLLLASAALAGGGASHVPHAAPVPHVPLPVPVDVTAPALPVLSAAPPPAASRPSPRHAEPAHGVGADDTWADLMAGNRRFVEGRPAPRALIASRESLASRQEPHVIVLGCADSRVSPELVFDKGLGDLFVVRAAGNVADAVALGSMEYAVEHLGAELLVVLGHEKCGAVAAAASGKAMPSPNLEAIVDRIAPAIDKLRYCYDGDDLVARGVEENVAESARALLDGSEILRHAVQSGELVVMKAVYRLRSGEVVPLGRED